MLVHADFDSWISLDRIGEPHELINMRKDARAKKDYATSDRIRNELLSLGIQLKDDKDGNISYTIN